MAFKCASRVMGRHRKRMPPSLGTAPCCHLSTGTTRNSAPLPPFGSAFGFRCFLTACRPSTHRTVRVPPSARLGVEGVGADEQRARGGRGPELADHRAQRDERARVRRRRQRGVDAGRPVDLVAEIPAGDGVAIPPTGINQRMSE